MRDEKTHLAIHGENRFDLNEWLKKGLKLSRYQKNLAKIKGDNKNENWKNALSPQTNNEIENQA